MFRAVYHSDPDEETIATFYGLIQRIPDKLKELWRPQASEDDRLDEMEEKLIARSRLEDISGS